MFRFTTERIFTIHGIGSASGLVYHDNMLTLIGDNSNFIYEYDLLSKSLAHHPLTPNPQENVAKKNKSDFEAIASDENYFYIFGSGSTSNRTLMVQADKKSKVVTAVHDLALLYQSMQNAAKIPASDFNIEGVTIDRKTWYFFQRGNGINGANAVFTVQTNNLFKDFTLECHFFKLPEIDGVKSSFTDAVAANGNFYFLAAAENTVSTYLDGAVFGSLIGSIGIKSMTIGFTEVISKSHKFEGITLFEESASEISFLLCEDNDTEILESGIYKLTLQKS